MLMFRSCPLTCFQAGHILLAQKHYITTYSYLAILRIGNSTLTVFNKNACFMFWISFPTLHFWNVAHHLQFISLPSESLLGGHIEAFDR